jgi:hypothetical protein
MVATHAPNPLLSFDTLPSGRFKYLPYRINLRRDWFRSQAISILNKSLF